MIRNFREQNIVVTMFVLVSVLIFSFNAIAEKPKTKVSISDPECQFVYLVEEFNYFSDGQKLLLDESGKMLNKDNLSGAIEKLKELAKSTNSFTAQYNLGLIYAKQGDLQAAETALVESIKIYPKQREAYKILSKVQNALGKKKESRYHMDCYLML
jgi:predicted Zn-dependent protease